MNNADTYAGTNEALMANMYRSAEPEPEDQGTTRVTISSGNDARSLDEWAAVQARAGTEPTTRIVSGPLTHSEGVVNQAPAADGIQRYVHRPEGASGGNIMATLQRGLNASICLVPGQEFTRTSVAAALRSGDIVERNGVYHRS